MALEPGKSMSALLEKPAMRAAESAVTAPAEIRDFAALALKSQAAALRHAKFEPAATAFLTELALGLGCERVTLGLRERNVIRVVASSHGSESRFGGSVYRDIGDAMDEAIDQRRALQVPDNPNSKPAILIAHQRLKSYLGGIVQTVPLRVHGECVGAVCCEWSGASSVAPLAHAPLEHIVDLVGPVLHLLYRAERPWSVRLRESISSARKKLTSDDGRTARWALGALVLLLVAGLFVPVDQHVQARARLEGAIEHAVVAPIDGFIESVAVRPGDTVRADQPLVILAAQDLELEARRWESELAQHESAYMASLARSERSDMMVSLSKAEEARARLDLAQRSLDRMRIPAGIDGVVIAGDVSRLQGAPVSRGDVLLTLAPADGYRVVLDVDERDIGQLKTGQHGVLALSAQPGSPQAVEVTRITPMASVVEGANVFRVEAQLVDASNALRPGLQGVAKITVAHEPIIQASWRWLSDRVRMLWWRWGG